MRIFEVETIYKNGITKTDFIEGKDENEVWKTYDKLHTDEEIDSSAIVDDWIA